jgi:hypothetical protein
LLQLAKRCSDGNEIKLPMSRQDIADYLGLAVETVSRTMTQLENDATITRPASPAGRFTQPSGPQTLERLALILLRRASPALRRSCVPAAALLGNKVEPVPQGVRQSPREGRRSIRSAKPARYSIPKSPGHTHTKRAPSANFDLGQCADIVTADEIAKRKPWREPRPAPMPTVREGQRPLPAGLWSERLGKG